MQRNKTHIKYGIIALTKAEAVEIVPVLKKDGKDEAAAWLEYNLDSVYGDVPEKWKPFVDSPIGEIVENHNYFNATEHISILQSDFSNMDPVYAVQVFFIDPFALFTDKYKQLAIRLDARFARTDLGNCCFLLYYGMSKSLQDKLESEIKKIWQGVWKDYKNGELHRLASRDNDLINFRNNILKFIEIKDLPNWENLNKAKAITGSSGSKDIPRI